jgi:hypothetical protein
MGNPLCRKALRVILSAIFISYKMGVAAAWKAG